MQEGVRGCTTKLKALQYDPDSWCSLGLYLLMLGYPELAIGDLYKSVMLFHTLIREDNKNLSKFGSINVCGCELRFAWTLRASLGHI